MPEEQGLRGGTTRGVAQGDAGGGRNVRGSRAGPQDVRGAAGQPVMSEEGGMSDDDGGDCGMLEEPLGDAEGGQNDGGARWDRGTLEELLGDTEGGLNVRG